MIFDYTKFKKFPLTRDISFFLIHGNPRNISNEIEHDIIVFQKKLGYQVAKYIVDDDSQTQSIINNINEQSLFEEKKIFTLNIVSKTIPNGLKKFLLTWSSYRGENKIIIKLDRQISAFKKSTFYKNFSQSECIIEIYELKDKVLEQWVYNKCNMNNVSPTDPTINKLIDSNMNNSLALSQNIYLRSLMNDGDSEQISQNSKYTEYDLVDMFLNKNNKGFMAVSNYLRSIDMSLTYILYILNTELEKLYFLSKPIEPSPYIPTFLKTKYARACKNYTIDNLLHVLKNMSRLDIDCKYNSKRSNPWTSLNSLFSSIMIDI